jgi:predicted TIM-barrel fold metal-dependent hydrolase
MVFDARVRLPQDCREQPTYQVSPQQAEQYDRVLQLTDKMNDGTMAALLTTMDDAGVDRAVMHAETEGGESADALNAALVTVMSEHQGRFVGIGTVDRLLYPVTCDSPDLTLIAAHAGWPWATEFAAVARRHPTVFLEFGDHRVRLAWGVPMPEWQQGFEEQFGLALSTRFTGRPTPASRCTIPSPPAIDRGPAAASSRRSS